MNRRAAVPVVLLLLAAALPAAAAPVAAGEKKTFTKTLPFAGDRDIKIGVRYGDVTIDSVRIRNWPDADDLEKAEKDRNDTTTMVVEFTYSNRDDDHDYKCRYTVTIPGKDGTPYGENDRTATLDAGKIDDTNKMFVKMKTRLYPTVKSFKVTFEIWRK